MSKLRSLSTAFWSDPFIEDLTPNQKLLFIYLVTNEKTNMLGIYESSVKKISFETGINKAEIEKGLKAFETVGKVKYINNYVFLTNYMKHQNFNTNMKKSAIDVYNNLPNDLKVKDLIVSKDNPIEGFESLSKGLGMVRKVEDEDEVEEEKSKVNKSKEYYRSFAHLLITKTENKKLLKVGYSQNQIDLIYDAIENYKKNTSYRSLFLTAKKWLKKEYPEIESSENEDSSIDKDYSDTQL